MRKAWWIILILVVAGSLYYYQGWKEKTAEAKTLTLATTTSTQDSGLLDELVPAFEKKSGIKVKVVAVGSGQAIELGKRGDADVLLVHSPQAEKEFMAGGYGVDRRAVMHNYFVLVGPPADPAKVSGTKEASQAFKTIAEKKAVFVSRGDQSGTHKKELSIWEKAGIKPGGPWYVQAGQGMGETLTTASERKAYTLSDEATFLTMKKELDLKVMVEGGKDLLNPYTVITVSQKKFPAIHSQQAREFSDFITGTEGQNLIRNFGKSKYGKSIFVPDAGKTSS